jgi:addiction module HigA family antidote
VADSAPIHPGKILAQRLQGIPMSASELSRHLAIPVNRITQIINGQRGISGDSALRLGRFFGTAPEFWLELQMVYELHIAELDKGDEVRQNVAMLNDVLKGREPPQAALFIADEAA